MVATAVALVAALVALVGGFYAVAFEPGYECAECDTDADCAEPYGCHPFRDGTSRCATTQLYCRGNEGPPWLRPLLVGAALVGGLAVSWRVTQRRIDER